MAFAALFGALGTTADEEIWKTIFRGTADVNVVNVDVVVTDREGQPVSGLTRADFELYDGDRQVEISNFFAVQDGEAVPLASLESNDETMATRDAGEEADRAEGASATTAAEAKPMHLILYVDNVNLAPANRSRVFERIREFLLAQRRLGPRVMLMSNDRSLRVRQDFTSVPHEIFVALAELEKTAAPSPRFEVERRNLLRAIERVDVEGGSGLFATKDRQGGDNDAGQRGMSSQQALTQRAANEAAGVFTEIQAYSRQRLQHTRDSLKVLRQLVATAAGLPGRKSVLYVSDGLPLRPGESIYEAYSQRFQALSDVGARVHAQSEAARDDATRDLQALLDLANASKVTFYTLDASPAERLSYGAAESDLGAGGNFGSWNDSMASTDTYNSQQGMRMLAQDTGGRFGPVHSAWGAVLDGVVTDFDNYYSLGFVADPLPPKGDPSKAAKRDKRRLKVKVRDPRLLVRHRSSFRQKPMTDRTAERTRAALLLDSVENPFGIGVISRPPEPQADGTFVVPISITIPLDKLVLLPGKTEHQGRVSMFVAVRDEQGRTSEVNRHLCPIRIANDEVLTALGQSAACGLSLKMRKGPQRIAVSVLDELTSLDSTAYLAVDIDASEQIAETASSR